MSETDSVRTFQSAWATRTERTVSPSFPTRVRSWLGRVTGRSDRYLAQRAAAATNEIVSHCDVLTDRVVSLEGLVAEVSGVLGQELAQLRAEVQSLRRVAQSQGDASESAP